MVKLSGFTSVNPNEQQTEGLSPTLEAEEAAVIDLYEQGIQAALDGHEQEAERCFRSVLSSDMVARGATEQLQRLEVLSAKNLAITVGKQSDRIEESIVLFREAIEKNPEDTGLVDRYGTLAARLGEWNASKDAFLTGLGLDGEHMTMKMKLVEILGHLADYQALDRVSQVLPRGSRRGEGQKSLLRNIPPPMPYNETTHAPKIEKCTVTVTDWMDLLNEVGARMSLAERPAETINILTAGCDDLVLELDAATDVDLDEGEVDNLESREGRMAESGSDVAQETHQEKVDQTPPRKTRRLRGNTNLSEPDSPSADLSTHSLSLLDMWMDKIREPSASFLSVNSTPALAEHIINCPSLESNASLLQQCIGYDWTLDSLCELLVLYFSMSDDLNNLEDQGKEYLADICWAVKRTIPLESALRMSEWLIDRLSSMKACSGIEEPLESSPGTFGSTKALAGKFLRICSINMGTQAMPMNHNGDGPDMNRARYLFVKAKYFEILEQMETAKQYFLECLDAIGCSEKGLRLCHVTQDNIVSHSRVKFKYDTLDVHSEIHKVRVLPATLDSRIELDSIASTVLSGPEREAFMLSIDRKGWSNILRELHDAAYRVKNFSVCQKCQIRLLSANFPAATAGDVEIAKEQPEIYVQPLLSTTFMNVIMNSIKIENIVYRTSTSVSLEEFELEMLRDVLRRLVLVMHASHQMLRSTVDHQGKKKNLKVLLSHSCAFFLALLPLEWDFDRDLAAIEILDDSFRALAEVDTLLFRKALVPYCAIPFLVSIHNRQGRHADGNFSLLEEQIQHLLNFAFGVVLSATERPENILYGKSFSDMNHRSPGCIEELAIIWPFCYQYFSSLSRQMLKRREGEFLEKSYRVAVDTLPESMKYHMISAMDKLGLLMPPNIGSSDVAGDPLTSFGISGTNEMDVYAKFELHIDASVVYSTVFHFYSLIHNQEVSALQRQEGRMVLGKPDRDFECKMDAVIWDLAFNKQRSRNWQQLAEFHQGMAEWILDECMMEGRALTHTESMRVSRHRKIGSWCSFFAIKCLEAEWQSQGMTEFRQGLMSSIFEFYGCSLLNQIADAPPEFDQWFKKPQETGAVAREVLQKALHAFIGISRVCPQKWSGHLFIGICLKRLGHKPSVYMPPLAQASKLAKEEFGAIIDPIYEIHASRLDLLESLWDFHSNTPMTGIDGPSREEILHQCALYCFGERPEVSGKEIKDRIIELYADALEAMKWCLEVDAHYYKASLRLGKSRYLDAEKRFEYMSNLFSRSKGDFIFNMWGIVQKGPNVLRAREKRKRTFKRDNNMMEIPYCGQDAAVSRILSGDLYEGIDFEGAGARPSQKLVGIGLDEDRQFSYIFRGKVRKALLEYIAIVKSLGSSTVLDKIILYLNNGGQGIFNVEEYQDISAICEGCKLIVILSKVNSILPVSELLDVQDPRIFLYDEKGPSILSNRGAPTRQQLDVLKPIYYLYLKYLFDEKKEWMSTVMRPVGSYMRWRIGEQDSSDELFGKVFLTSKKGAKILGHYSCLYLRNLTEVSEGESVLGLYHEYFKLKRTTSIQKGSASLGMVLCMNAWQFLKNLVEKEMNSCATTSSITENTILSRMTRMCDLVASFAKNVMAYASQSMRDDFTRQLQEALRSTLVPEVELLIQNVVQIRRREELGDLNLHLSIRESMDFLGLSPEDQGEGGEQHALQEEETEEVVAKGAMVSEDRQQGGESPPMRPSEQGGSQGTMATPVCGGSGGIAAEAIMAAIREAEGVEDEGKQIPETQMKSAEGASAPENSSPRDDRHAPLSTELLSSIADVFQEQKLTKKSTAESAISMENLSWKPDVSLVAAKGKNNTVATIDIKHGNSYRTIQATSKGRPPAKSASKEWFHLPTQEITDQLKTDLRVLRLRSAFDPKQFYKKFDETKFPTQFHVGTVVEAASDFYSSRLTNKQRKSTMAEEIMHDPYLSSVRRKRYNRIQDDAGYWSQKPRGRKTNNPRIKKKPRKAKH